jgi:List-Bact-rpt repeat protein
MARTRRRLLVAALAACALVAGPTGAAQAHQADYTLRVFVNGNGTVKGSGIECGAKGTTCGVSYALGTTVTIEAEPSPSSIFAGWDGACTGIGTTCTFTAGEPTTVTASFNYIEVVDVNKIGDGQGTVTSSPAGISCGYTCSAPYTGNTKVTLAAHPAAGSVFVGWNGYCKGRSQCVLQQTYGTMAVTAEFQPAGKRKSFTTGESRSGSGLTVSTHAHAGFETSSMGSSVAKTATGRLITVRFQVSKPAAVRLQIWSWKKHLISQGRLSVHAGPVTVRLPFSAGYKAGQYDIWAYVTGAGEKKYKLLHWKVRVP